MKRLSTCAFLLGVISWLAPQGLAQAEVDKLLDQLAKGPLNQGDLWSLEAQPSDPRTIPALRAAFERRNDKKERQLIAASLLSLGDKSEKYFDYLAKFASEAVDDRTPFFIKTRGEFTADFLNWCAQNGQDPKAIATLQTRDYPEDVAILAGVRDPRAIELFRRGLDSPNVW